MKKSPLYKLTLTVGRILKKHKEEEMKKRYKEEKRLRGK